MGNWRDDLWDDQEAPMASSAPVAPKSPKPKLTAAERREKKARDLRSERSQIGAATAKRRRWEASPVGQARTRDIVDLATEAHNRLAAQHPDKLRPVDRLRVTPAQIYHLLGVTNEGHGHGSQQLPGFENPHSAPQPPRWEDLPEKVRAKTEHNMRLAGTSIDQMSRDFGAQLDQAIWRAHTAGHHRESTGEPVPFTAHFYGDHPHDAPEPLDRPKDMLRESRQYLAGRGIHADPSVHVAAVGHTSPNVKFTQGERGNRTSPNIEAAEAVFEQHAEGTPAHLMKSGKNRRGITNQSRPANSRRAGRMLEHVARGEPLATARNFPSASYPQGSSQWGPKTGPFPNSFDSLHPDFLVGDVHTLGGGMLPHHETSKPLRRVEGGQMARHSDFKDDPRPDKQLMKEEGRRAFQPDKSGREKMIERIGTAVNPKDLPGVEWARGKKITAHSAADYAARMAVEARGLGSSVRRPQASQWGEEQIQRKVASPKLDVPSHEDAYPDPRPAAHAVHPGQLRLF